MRKKLAALTGKTWSCGRQVTGGREAVDVYGELGGRPVYIEVELRRDEPEASVKVSPQRALAINSRSTL